MTTEEPRNGGTRRIITVSSSTDDPIAIPAQLDTSIKLGDEGFTSRLTSALHGAYDQGLFRHETFFQQWLRHNNGAYFFLFHKNLSVTNLQYGELLALLRLHSHYQDSPSERPRLQFISAPTFQRLLITTTATFETTDLDEWHRCQVIAELYGPIFSQLVVIDPFYGSCGVYVPPSLRVDLQAIAAFSGYVHSCGLSVYTRNINKADPGRFLSCMNEHLTKNPPPTGKKRFFAVYAHEDFSYYDRDKARQLRNGLDDVKIYIEKNYMQGRRLLDVLGEMRKDTMFRGRLAIPDSGDYRIQHRKLRGQGLIDLERTLWMITDRAIGDDGSAGSTRYYICYDQLYKNGSRYHIFDEDMPAWTSPTTIPHTLAGAMLNISRPDWPLTRPTQILDPFVGSGTVWLQTIQFHEVVPQCSDLLSLTESITRDNLLFFLLTPSRIRQLRERASTIRALGESVQ